MKSVSYLFVFIIFFMYVEIKGTAQQQPSQIIVPEQGIADINAYVQKGDKDTAQQKKRIIVIDKGRLDQLKDLQSLEGLKNLQSLDQLKALESLGQLKNLQIPDIPDVPDVTVLGYGGIMRGSKDLSELRLTKSFKGESVESTKKFSVSPDYAALNFNLSGKVKSGVISVTLFKPNGSKYKSIEIDPTSDVSFSQGIDLKKEPKEWTGDWQIKIKSEKADGDYRLTILTR